MWEFSVEATRENGEIEVFDFDLNFYNNVLKLGDLLDDIDNGEYKAAHVISTIVEGDHYDWLNELYEAVIKFHNDFTPVQQGAVYCLMEDRYETLVKAVEIAESEDYSHYEDLNLYDLGEMIADINGVYNTLKNTGIIPYVKFDEYAEDQLSDYTYQEDYGYYYFY